MSKFFKHLIRKFLCWYIEKIGTVLCIKETVGLKVNCVYFVESCHIGRNGNICVHLAGIEPTHYCGYSMLRFKVVIVKEMKFYNKA